ncbi:MAG TPA: hypothetical protein VIK18_03145 [Pirellulales bacterium]
MPTLPATGFTAADSSPATYSRSRATRSGRSGSTSLRRCFESAASTVIVAGSATSASDAAVRLASSAARKPVLAATR